MCDDPCKAKIKRGKVYTLEQHSVAHVPIGFETSFKTNSLSSNNFV